jgi:hypothetical protein
VRKYQFILRRGDRVERILNTVGGETPMLGHTYNVHPVDGGDPTQWKVAEVHRELFPGGLDLTEFNIGEAIEIADPERDYHVGDVTVVVLDPI